MTPAELSDLLLAHSVQISDRDKTIAALHQRIEDMKAEPRPEVRGVARGLAALGKTISGE